MLLEWHFTRSVRGDHLRLERVESTLKILDVALAWASLERALAVRALDTASTAVHTGLNDEHVALRLLVRLKRSNQARHGVRMARLARESADDIATRLAAATLVTGT